MDLIYTDSTRKDIGVLDGYTLDMAIGSDENNFEISVDESTILEKNALIYIADTEYGGIIDSISSNTANNEVKYNGRTWHGILSRKILKPSNGQPYLVLNGNANTIINQLISLMGLADFFAIPQQLSPINITNYQMDRYIDGYSGICKMLKKNGGKLEIKYDGSKVILNAVNLNDYSVDEEFDSSQLNFKVEKHYNKVNHLVLLGQGELTERIVSDLYLDQDGNIGTTQYYFGLDEISEVYENVNAETLEKLIEEGTDKFQDILDTDSIDVSFDEYESKYDIGDIVGAYESVTDTFVKEYITKKIIKISSDEITIDCEVG